MFCVGLVRYLLNGPQLQKHRPLFPFHNFAHSLNKMQTPLQMFSDNFTVSVNHFYRLISK